MNWFIKFLKSRKILLKEKEFKALPEDFKSEYLQYIVYFSENSPTFEYDLFSDEQKLAYITRLATKTKASLTDDWFKILPDDLKMSYLKDRVGNYHYHIRFTNFQADYFDISMLTDMVGRWYVNEYIFNLMPDDLKIKHMNKVKYNIGLDGWLLDYYRDNRKRRATTIIRNKNIDDILSDDVHEEATNTN
jgi:hypothetical protein